MPGFVDNHLHPLEFGLSLMFPSLRGLTQEEILDTFAQRKEDFIYAFNYTPSNEKPLTEKELNKFNKPVVIRKVDGHSVYLNNRAQNLLKAHGFEHRGKDNEQIIEKWENEFIDKDIKIEAFLKADRTLIKEGIVRYAALTGNDYPSNNDCELLDSIKHRLKAQPYIFCQTYNIKRVLRNGWQRIGGCILIDGSFGSHTAALLEPYNDKDTKGILYPEQKRDEFLAFLERAIKYELQTAFHAIGDRAISFLLDAYEKVIEKPNPLKARVEHAELLNDELLTRISRLKLILSMQPAFISTWGGKNKMYDKRLGTRWKNTARFKDIIERDIILVSGSDAPITYPSPIKGIKTLINNPNKEQSIDLSLAIKTYTSYGHYALNIKETFFPSDEGIADIVIFNNNPFKNGEITHVIKEGKIVYKN